MIKACGHRYKNECHDKKSVHYFMFHMTQKEFEEIRRTRPVIKNFKFNIIQPERSKREDIDELGHEFTGIPTTEESWCEKCGEEDHVIISKMMRCSGHGGNIVREVQ